MTEPTPITPDIVPSVDGEREFCDYLMQRVRDYCSEHGEAPHSAAVVLLSADGGKSDAHSWSPYRPTYRYVTCSLAATLLLKRALDE